jgi:divalent metal cation (Fe/Co/Zn/Cd) transporter
VASDGIDYHALRTRRAGAHRFVSVHVLVPPGWSVQQGHDLLERIEADIRRTLPPVSVLTHLEPLGDPAAMRDAGLRRPE